jgi:hypothetical protein
LAQQQGADVMLNVTQNTHPMNLLFGSGFVAEQHAEPVHIMLPKEPSQLQFEVILQSLRRALNLRP